MLLGPVLLGQSRAAGVYQWARAERLDRPRRARFPIAARGGSFGLPDARGATRAQDRHRDARCARPSPSLRARAMLAALWVNGSIAVAAAFAPRGQPRTAPVKARMARWRDRGRGAPDRNVVDGCPWARPPRSVSRVGSRFAPRRRFQRRPAWPREEDPSRALTRRGAESLPPPGSSARPSKDVLWGVKARPRAEREVYSLRAASWKASLVCRRPGPPRDRGAHLQPGQGAGLHRAPREGRCRRRNRPESEASLRRGRGNASRVSKRRSWATRKRQSLAKM